MPSTELPARHRGVGAAAPARRADPPDRHPGSQAGQTALIGTLSVLALAAFFLIGDSWWQLILAAYGAMLSAQLAALGRGLRHFRIFRSPGTDYLVGVTLTNLGVGLSYDWWTRRPGRRPAAPGEADDEPDLRTLVRAFAAWAAPAGGLPQRVCHRHQGSTLVPLLILKAVTMRLGSTRHLLSGRARRRLTELPLIGLHLLGYPGAIFLVLPPGKGLAFIAVHQGLFGLYLGYSFALGHPGMR
ncbi:hypothetical protein [Actinoplanes sp. NPDC049599]|uniref:hypothetical protein n=1 Tax=Actinoplanes sp. NPDC049599 TaxID=3363903 RepID=UPI0037AD3D26